MPISDSSPLLSVGHPSRGSLTDNPWEKNDTVSPVATSALD